MLLFHLMRSETYSNKGHKSLFLLLFLLYDFNAIYICVYIFFFLFSFSLFLISTLFFLSIFVHHLTHFHPTLSIFPSSQFFHDLYPIFLIISLHYQLLLFIIVHFHLHFHFFSHLNSYSLIQSFILIHLSFISTHFHSFSFILIYSNSFLI